MVCRPARHRWQDGLWRRPDRFALGALLIVMGFVVSLNLINPDAFIVRQNMARYWHGGDLDVVYLEPLSAGAVPALIEALAEGDKAGKEGAAKEGAAKEGEGAAKKADKPGDTAWGHGAKKKDGEKGKGLLGKLPGVGK